MLFRDEERHIACPAADVEDLHPRRDAGILEEVSRRRVEELRSLFESSRLFLRPAHDVCRIVFHGDRPGPNWPDTKQQFSAQ